MTVYKEFNIGSGKGSPLGSFGPIIALVLFFVLLFFVAKGLFWILSWVAPVLLLATLVIDHKVVVDYGKFIWKLLRENPLMGIVGIVLSVIGFPVVSGFLFLKAIARKTINSKLKSMGHTEEEEEFAEYEEVKEEDFLKLPDVEKATRSRTTDTSTNEYEDLFE